MGGGVHPCLKYFNKLKKKIATTSTKEIDRA